MTIYNHSEGAVEETKTTKGDTMTTTITKNGFLIASVKRNERNNKTIEQYGQGHQWGITNQIVMSNGISIGPEGLKTDGMTMPTVWPPGPPKARKGTTIILSPGCLYNANNTKYGMYPLPPNFKSGTAAAAAKKEEKKRGRADEATTKSSLIQSNGDEDKEPAGKKPRAVGHDSDREEEVAF